MYPSSRRAEPWNRTQGGSRSEMSRKASEVALGNQVNITKKLGEKKKAFEITRGYRLLWQAPNQQRRGYLAS